MNSNLDRFVNAQKEYYDIALNEIKSGKKQTHWIWYIFPQLECLGKSSTAKYYGIKSINEAKDYLKNDYLRNNLIEISHELLKINKKITDIVNYPDDLKIKSCMTLFNYIDPNIDTFEKVLNKFYEGEKDILTINKLHG